MSDEEDAADTYKAYLERLKQPMKVWSPPKLTEQEQKERDEYIKLHKCPF